MSHTIQLNESDIRDMVKQAIYGYYTVSEGKIGRALGTAALGGMLAFGNMANAKPADNTPSYSQTITTQTNTQNVDFSNLIKSNVTEDPNTGDIIGNYQLVYHTDLDAEAMYHKLVDDSYDSTSFRIRFYGQQPSHHFFPFNDDCSISEINGMYKITYGGSYQNDKQQKAVFTIYLKDGVFKITANLSNNTLKTLKDRNSTMYDRCLKMWTDEWPKNDIAAIAKLIVEKTQGESNTPKNEIDIRSEFDF